MRKSLPIQELNQQYRLQGSGTDAQIAHGLARTAPGHSARTFPADLGRKVVSVEEMKRSIALACISSRRFPSVLSFLGRDGRLIAKPDFSPMQSQLGTRSPAPFSACAAERGAFACSRFCEDDVRRKRTACQSPNLKSEVRQPWNPKVKFALGILTSFGHVVAYVCWPFKRRCAAGCPISQFPLTVGVWAIFEVFAVRETQIAACPLWRTLESQRGIRIFTA